MRNAKTVRSGQRVVRVLRGLSVAAGLAACGLGNAALARAAGMTDTVTVLPPVIIEGTRPLDGARSTTTSLRLDRNKLSRFQPATVNDALLSLPGVDLVKTGAWASKISLRGLAGDRVLLLVDGVRMNGVRGHGGQASLVSVDRLDAVEVQPGASSAQYGSDALGGVVQLSTHRSLIDSRAGAQLTIQSHGSSPDEGWGASSRLSARSSRYGFELAGGAGGLDALVTPEGRTPHSGYREKNLSGRAAVQFGRALVDYEHTWSAAYDVGLPAFQDALGSHGSYPLQSRDVDRFEVARPGHGATPDARLLASLQRGRSQFNEVTVTRRTQNGRLRGYNVNDAWDDARTRALSLQPSVQWPRLANLRFAGEYRRETTGGPRVTEVTTKNTLFVPTDTTTSLGESMPNAWRESGSASAMIAPTWRRTRLELGTRYDQFRSRADSTEISTTPRLAKTDRRWSVDGGLSRPFGNLEPYLHVASGFRVPNLEERFYHDEIHGGMVVFGNPRLAAERSVSGEFGLRLRELGILQSARASVYRSNVQDLISVQYVDMLYGRPQFEYRNVKRARLEGVEAQVQLKARRVVLAVNGTLPRGRDLDTGKKLTDPGTARVTADLSFPVPRLVPNGQLALRVRWNDAITGVDTTLARPAFSTTSIELSTLWAGVRASVAIRNLLDHSYREPLSFIDEPGRIVAFSLRRDVALGLPFLKKKD